MKQQNNFTYGLAILCLLLCFAYFFYISIADHESNINIGEIKTAMISFVTMILGYFFGSSRSSHQKDENIDTLINRDKKQPESKENENGYT